MATPRRSTASLVDPARTAVLVVDVQPFFTDQELVPAVDEVLPRLRSFLDAAREAGALRVFIRAEFPQERWTEVWREQFGSNLEAVVAPGSPKMQFHADFEPESDDAVVVKDRYSSFLGTELESLLRSRGIETVVVTGLVTDLCVSSTARDAFQLDFHTITLADCTATGSRSRHDVSLETLAVGFGRVCSSREVVDAWQTYAARLSAPTPLA